MTVQINENWWLEIKKKTKQNFLADFNSHLLMGKMEGATVGYRRSSV